MRHLALFQLLLLPILTTTLVSVCQADESQMPVVYETGFEKGADEWQPTDPGAWELRTTDKGTIYAQHLKKSDYQPPHRSPLNISLLQDVSVTDFVLTAKVRSTHPDYGHRDACLVFNYQDPAHFYYVHLGKKTDDHANQIFIVNESDRTKISTETTPGTNWDDKWHTVKIKRDVASGRIEVFFDDMEKPVMVASDKTFQWGQIGLGTFDDTSAWDDVVLRGMLARPPANQVLPGSLRVLNKEDR